MTIIKAFDNINNLLENPIVHQCQRGKWNDWKRLYVLKNPTNEKITVVSLNCFQRMANVLLKLFCCNYFKLIFKEKNIEIVPSSQLKHTNKISIEQVKQTLVPNPKESTEIKNQSKILPQDSEKKVEPPTDSASKVIIQDPTELQKKNSIILYMSITGNPTHLGHMAAVATAIDTLMKKGFFVEKALVSLSFESYHISKVQRDLNKGIKKIALTQTARVHVLNETIKEANKRNMFNGVQVSYWDDQDQGESDHPDSYRRLVSSAEKTQQVFLVAGIDLCKSMNNWPNLENAIVIKRDMEESEQSFNPPPSTKNRIYVDSLYPEFKKFSSTAIQNGTQKLEPPSLQEYFNQQQQIS